jgi:hypothetical protein
MSLAQLVDICIIMQGIGVRTFVIPLIHLKPLLGRGENGTKHTQMEIQIIRLFDKKKL